MGLFNFSKEDYNDDNITKQAQRAIENHPMLEKSKRFSVEVKEGIITLKGKIKDERMKNRIEKEIKGKLNKANVRYKEIINEIEVK